MPNINYPIADSTLATVRSEVNQTSSRTHVFLGYALLLYRSHSKQRTNGTQYHPQIVHIVNSIYLSLEIQFRIHESISKQAQLMICLRRKTHICIYIYNSIQQILLFVPIVLGLVWVFPVFTWPHVSRKDARSSHCKIYLIPDGFYHSSRDLSERDSFREYVCVCVYGLLAIVICDYCDFILHCALCLQDPCDECRDVFCCNVFRNLL